MTERATAWLSAASDFVWGPLLLIPLLLLTGLFLTVYFAGRFSVEFVKEYHVLGGRSALTMGQYLSVLPFAAGIALLIWSFRARRVTADLPKPPDVEEGKNNDGAKKK